MRLVAISGTFDEWQRAQFSAKTTLPRVSTRWSVVRNAAPPGASASLCGSVVFRKNRATSKVCASVAAYIAEFSRATEISIGVIGLPPTSGLKCLSHSSLNVPMFR